MYSMNLMLGQNVKWSCDDCCGLHNLVKRFEKEGKAEEVEAARKALHQHKKRADWKQRHHQVRRTNAVSSLNDARLQMSSVSLTQTVVDIFWLFTDPINQL